MTIQYNIYWSLSPAVTKLTGTKISDVTFPYVHSSLTCGIPYYYVATVYDTDTGLESAESNEMSGIPLCQPDDILIISDNDRHRINIRDRNLLTYVSEYGSFGSDFTLRGGDALFNGPSSSCSDGTYIYTLDAFNYRLVKKTMAGVFVAEKGAIGGKSSNFIRGCGSDSFDNAWGITTDGIYLYIADGGNNRIKKHRCSDLGFVASWGELDQFNPPYIQGGFDVDATGNYLIAVDEQHNPDLFKIDISNWNVVSCGPTTDAPVYDQGLSVNGNYFYTIEEAYAWQFRNCRIGKWKLPSGVGTDTEWILESFRDTENDFGNTISSESGICNDGSYLYTLEYAGEIQFFGGTLTVDSIDNTKITSSEYSFTSADINRWIAINSSVDWSGGNYQIISVSGSAALLSSSPASVNTTGGWGSLTLTQEGNQTVLRRSLDDMTIVSVGGDAGYFNPTDPAVYIWRARGVAVDDTYLYIVDEDWITKILKSNMSYVDRIASNYATGVAVDDDYLYTIDNIDPWTLRKRNKSTLAILATNSADFDSWGYAKLATKQGSDLFVSSPTTGRISRVNKSDLSIISRNKSTNDADFYDNPNGFITNNSFQYPQAIALNPTKDKLVISDYYNNRIKIHNPTTLEYISEYDFDMTFVVWSYITGVAMDDTYIYYLENSFNEYTTPTIRKHLISNFDFIARDEVNVESFDVNSYGGEIFVDEEFVYALDSNNSRLLKFYKDDMTFVDYVSGKATDYEGENFAYPSGVWRQNLTPIVSAPKIFGNVVW